MLQVRFLPNAFVNALLDDGQPAWVNPATVSTAPVVRFVQRLDHVDLVRKKRQDSDKGIDIVVDPRGVLDIRRRRSPETMLGIFRNRFKTDQPVDANPLASVSIQDQAVGPLPKYALDTEFRR